MLLIWCVHSACDPIFGQRPTINSLYVQLWLRTYMCSTTKSQLHLTWLEVWWSLGSYPSMFHHAMRGDTLSHSIETIIWLMMIIWSDPSMFHDAVSPWSLHIYHYEAMQGQGPHFPPTRKATIHIHRGEGGKGVKMGTLHWGGVGGGLAKPGSYITFVSRPLESLLCKGGSQQKPPLNPFKGKFEKLGCWLKWCFWLAQGLPEESQLAWVRWRWKHMSWCFVACAPKSSLSYHIFFC